MADDLTDEFLGATIVGFGASSGTQESLSALFKKKRSNLEVTLTAETKFSRGAINAFRAAFALDEHGQFLSDLIGFRDAKRAGFALDTFFGKLERNHGDAPQQG